MKRGRARQVKQVAGNADLMNVRGSDERNHLAVGIVLWLLGVIVFATLSFVVHNHPGFWPFELSFANLIQGSHPIPCTYSLHTRTWVDADADLINRMNDPIPSIVVPIVCMVILAFFRRFRAALLLGLATLTATMVWGAIETLVARPRATPKDGICVHRIVNVYSFPSGHVTHDVVFYGFLLYLSFTGPVQRWRYHWLLPLQALVVIYLLVVGFSRVEAGEHHLIDVLGGYLLGVLWLCIFIFLYHWIGALLAKKHWTL
jgi:membrane-associated phospholipid phosphatase